MNYLNQPCVYRHQSHGKMKLNNQGRHYELRDRNETAVQTTVVHRVHDEVERTVSDAKEKEALDELPTVAPETPAEGLFPYILVVVYNTYTHTVIDRANPVSLTSFRSHVQNMHDDRAKGFEAEYQVIHLLYKQYNCRQPTGMYTPTTSVLIFN